MKVLVTAGTGTIGSRVVDMLRKRTEIEVSQATRRPLNPDQVTLDMSSESKTKELLDSLDKIVLITPATPTEQADAVRLIQQARRSRIKHVVFMSIHNVQMAPHIPHFAAKIATQNELQRSGIPWTTIAPNNFYQNDCWFQSSLINWSVYPQPFGNQGLARVDAEDIAEALVTGVTDESLAGQIYPLIGPENLTVQDVCNHYSELLKKPILYGGDDLHSWFENNKAFLPEWLLKDWMQMYAYFQRHGLKASAQDYIQQEKILKRPPRSFAIFAKELIKQWKNTQETL